MKDPERKLQPKKKNPIRAPTYTTQDEWLWFF